MSEPEFDPVGILRGLSEHEVRFVVVGGFAAALLGSSLVTRDIDVCYDRAPDNLERLANALRALNARLRVAGVDEELPFILDARTLAAGDCFTFLTDLGSLDILGTPSGTSGFGDLQAQAKALKVATDLEVLVVSLGDLMRMKRASARMKDRAHLEELAVLREMIEERTQRGASS